MPIGAADTLFPGCIIWAFFVRCSAKLAIFSFIALIQCSYFGISCVRAPCFAYRLFPLPLMAMS